MCRPLCTGFMMRCDAMVVGREGRMVVKVWLSVCLSATRIVGESGNLVRKWGGRQHLKNLRQLEWEEGKKTTKEIAGMPP